MWVKIDGDLPDNPKFKRLCRATGWDEDQAVGKLYRLWRWSLKFAEDGNLADYGNLDIEDAMKYAMPAGSSNLLEVLIECGFVDTKPYLRIHDWHHYALKYLHTKYSGTDNDDIPKRLKRAYKSVKSNRTGTVLEQVGTKSEDLPLIRPAFNGEKPSSKTAVEQPTAGGNDKQKTAFAPQSFPEKTEAQKPLGPPAPDERADLLAFMRANPPPKNHPVAPLDADAEHDGRTLRRELARYQLFGMQALWTIYVRPGHSGFEFARNRRFLVKDFLRQIPHLVDSDDYPTEKRRHSEAIMRRFSEDRETAPAEV